MRLGNVPVFISSFQVPAIGLSNEGCHFTVSTECRQGTSQTPVIHRGCSAAILEGAKEMTVQDIREALITASMLIGNANAKLTHLRREKLISAINDNLSPLINFHESQFTDVAPYLFGSDFVKQAKEYLGQVGALKSTISEVEP